MRASRNTVAGSGAAGPAHRRGKAVGILGVALLLVACATGDPTPPADTTSHSPPATLRPTGSTPPTRPARSGIPPVEPAVIEVAYRRFWTVIATLDTLPPPQWRALLSTVATDPLLTRVYDGIEANYEAGIREYGVVHPRPTVVSAGGGRASVLDCQDASMSGEIDTDTGMPTTVGSARTPVAATLVHGPDGTWRLSEARYLDGSC
jgi:hypothetical protein